MSKTRWPAACCRPMAASSPKTPVSLCWWSASVKEKCIAPCWWGNLAGALQWCRGKVCGNVGEVEVQIWRCWLSGFIRSSGLSGGVMLPIAPCGELASRGCSLKTMHETFPSCLILVQLWGARPMTGPYVSTETGSALMFGCSRNTPWVVWKGVELTKNLPWIPELLAGRKLVSMSERRSSAIRLLYWEGLFMSGTGV